MWFWIVYGLGIASEIALSVYSVIEVNKAREEGLEGYADEYVKRHLMRGSLAGGVFFIICAAMICLNRLVNGGGAVIYLFVSLIYSLLFSSLEKLFIRYLGGSDEMKIPLAIYSLYRGCYLAIMTFVVFSMI